MTIQALLYFLARPFMWLVSVLPFFVLHRLSDILYLLVRLVGYRKKVIDANLYYAFPEKGNKERARIRNAYYRHFCDLFFETMKLQSISVGAMKRRMAFDNLELIENYALQKRDVIVVMAHYCNWEWVPSVNLHITPVATAVYHPLKNKYMDGFMYRIRTRFGTLNFPKKATLREVVKLKRKQQRYILGLISDQSPARIHIQHRTVFLNQNTAVHLGAEKIAKTTGDPVVYLKVEKVKRSCYKGTFVPLFDNPKDTGDFEITEAHIGMLESQIMAKPEFWLWSHKRWKYSPNRTAIDAESLKVDA
jgi:Kdo2-lipid IVA lauroyltransferase/acyltransferase